MDETTTPTGPVRDYVASLTINIAVPVAARTRGQVRNYIGQLIKPLIAVELASFRDGQRLCALRQHDATTDDPKDVPDWELQSLLKPPPPLVVEDRQWSPQELLELAELNPGQIQLGLNTIEPRFTEAAIRAAWAIVEEDPASYSGIDDFIAVLKTR